MPAEKGKKRTKKDEKTYLDTLFNLKHIVIGVCREILL